MCKNFNGVVNVQYYVSQYKMCSCQAWKPVSNSQESSILPSLTDICYTCQHPLESHVQQIKDLSDDHLDRVLLVVYDMDNILLQMRNEKEDPDLRKTYRFLFNFLHKNMLLQKLPSLAGDKLGVPPFEKVSIAKVPIIKVYKHA